MNIFKKITSNKIKQECKYFLLTLLKIPFNRVNLPVEIMQWLSPSKPINFIDIGASKGDFSKSLSSFYKIKKGIIVEPIPDRMPVLRANFSDNSIYSVLNIAVSNKIGETDFFVSEYDVLSSLMEMKREYEIPFNISSQVKITVKTNTLDNISMDFKKDIIDIIKIDVQGAEHLVLNSGLSTLKMTKLLYTEFSYKPMYESSSTFFDLFKILTENNFRMVNISTAYKLQNGEIVQGDALFINNDLLTNYVVKD